MKTKFKLQGLLFIALLYTSLICLNWYTNLNETREYVVENKDYKLSPTEVKTYIKKPHHLKDYYILKKAVYEGKNSLIPFIVDKKLIKLYEPVIVSE